MEKQAVKLNKLMMAMVVAGVLAGCADKGGEQGGEQTAAGRSTTAVSGPDQVIAGTDADGRTTALMPFRDVAGRNYAPHMTLGQQFNYGSPEHLAYIDLYWSKTDPVDNALLAYTLSPEFAAEKDAFKRQDMLAALQPQIDAYLQRVRTIGDVAIKLDDTLRVGPYDMEKKAYPLFLFIPGKSLTVSVSDYSPVEYTVYTAPLDMTDMTNGDFMLPVDEAGAREIEGKLASMRDGMGFAHLPIVFKGRVFHAQGFERGGGDAPASVNSAELEAVLFPDAFDLLLPGSDDVLLTLTSKELGPGFPVDSDFLGSMPGTPPARAGYDIRTRIGLDDFKP